MAGVSERDAGLQLGRTVVLILLWGLFAGALYMSARQGVALAAERLSSDEKGAGESVSPGISTAADGGDQPSARE